MGVQILWKSVKRGSWDMAISQIAAVYARRVLVLLTADIDCVGLSTLKFILCPFHAGNLFWNLCKLVCFARKFLVCEQSTFKINKFLNFNAQFRTCSILWKEFHLWSAVIGQSALNEAPFTLEIYFKILFRNKNFNFLESEHIHIGNELSKAIGLCKQYCWLFILCL